LKAVNQIFLSPSSLSQLRKGAWLQRSFTLSTIKQSTSPDCDPLLLTSILRVPFFLSTTNSQLV
jgi:hypothetical protein